MEKAGAAFAHCIRDLRGSPPSMIARRLCRDEPWMFGRSIQPVPAFGNQAQDATFYRLGVRDDAMPEPPALVACGAGLDRMLVEAEQLVASRELARWAPAKICSKDTRGRRRAVKLGGVPRVAALMREAVGDVVDDDVADARIFRPELPTARGQAPIADARAVELGPDAHQVANLLGDRRQGSTSSATNPAPAAPTSAPTISTVATARSQLMNPTWSGWIQKLLDPLCTSVFSRRNKPRNRPRTGLTEHLPAFHRAVRGRLRGSFP